MRVPGTVGCFAVGLLCPLLLSCATDPFKDHAPWHPGEGQHYNWAGKPHHKTCLALSGGGIRAASFSVGVLQGLHGADLLRSMDVVSATSGGAYASSWLYNAHINRGLTLDDALAPRAQEQLRLAHDADDFVGKGWGLWTAATGVLVEPFSRAYKKIACSVPVDPHLTPGGAMAAYQAALWLTFYGRTTASFAELASDPTMPEFVIGVTAIHGESPSCAKSDQRPVQKAGEISASGLRVDGQLYRAGPIEWGINEVVVAAGGATDVVAPDSKGFNVCKLPAMIRPLLGSMACTPLAPESPKTYLTDGGFTDNLAILPLIRRQCDTIISVDASHDPGLEFEDLLNLRPHLVQIGIDVDGIASAIAPQPYDGRFRADSADSVVAISDMRSSGKFIYVKLGIPIIESHELPETVAETHSLSRAQFNGLSGCTENRHGTMLRCRFPQESTLRQAYFPSEYVAYRDLGHWIARNRLVPLLSSNHVITAAVIDDGAEGAGRRDGAE